MFAPEAWLALLRVVVGAWFVKAVWTKLSLVSLPKSHPSRLICVQRTDSLSGRHGPMARNSFGALASFARRHRELALENLALRQQLAVWKARQPRPRLVETDRIFWIVLWRLCTR
jgi:hypothetical protein